MKPNFKITKSYIETHFGHDNVKTITLPASTTEIDEFAFFDCASIETLDLSLCEEILCMPTLSTRGIKKVILPPNLMEFRSACFSRWTNCIEEVDMSQCSYLEEIPKDLFRGCTELKKISLPDSIKKIGFGAFNSCYSLSDINLPKSLEVLEEESFSWNKAISHIDFLACSNLRHIGVNTFFQCTSLDEIVLPDSIEELGAHSFCRCISVKKIDLSRCTKLRQLPPYCFGDDEGSDFDGMQLKEILLPPSLEVIDDSSFVSCTKLEELDLSNCQKLKEIGTFAFEFCTELKELDLSNCQKLKEIGKCAFKDCKKLKTLIIPDCVETIGNFFIHNCERLSALTLPKSLVEFPQLGAGDEENCSLKRLKVVDMHNCHLIKECTTPLVEIAENKIEVIAIPDGVELVEEDFFKGLKRLKSIYLPPTLTEVEIPEDEYKNVVIYCFSPELDSLEDIVERCACLYVLPQYLNNYKEQAEAEEVSGNIEQIPDDKLYFYDE